MVVWLKIGWEWDGERNQRCIHPGFLYILSFNDWCYPSLFNISLGIIKNQCLFKCENYKRPGMENLPKKPNEIHYYVIKKTIPIHSLSPGFPTPPPKLSSWVMIDNNIILFLYSDEKTRWIKKVIIAWNPREQPSRWAVISIIGRRDRYRVDRYLTM